LPKILGELSKIAGVEALSADWPQSLI
jgi:hypothetical protein